MHLFTALRYIFLVLTLIWTNQGIFEKNAMQCGKRVRKRDVERHLKYMAMILQDKVDFFY